MPLPVRLCHPLCERRAEKRQDERWFKQRCLLRKDLSRLYQLRPPDEKRILRHRGRMREAAIIQKLHAAMDDRAAGCGGQVHCGWNAFLFVLSAILSAGIAAAPPRCFPVLRPVLFSRILSGIVSSPRCGFFALLAVLFPHFARKGRQIRVCRLFRI